MIEGQLPVIITVFISAFLYYAAFGLHFLKGKTGNLIAKIVWGLAFAANTGVVIYNWLVNGYVPFVSMYQVLTFLSFCFLPIFFYISFMNKGGWMARYFCIASGVCMTGVGVMSAKSGVDLIWHFPPALQSVWFVPHILAYMIAYSLCTVAFIITVISFFDKKNAGRLDGGAYNLVCTAFPFMTCGMFFGAIWANAVWGNFWSWDIKENWSLITWLFFMLYLHFRRQGSLKKWTKLFLVLGFVGLVFTMLFVNMLGGDSSPHTYSG